MGVKVKEKVKGSGEWWIYINHHGERKAKKCGSKKTALQAARDIEARLTLGDLNVRDFNKKVPTFKDYAEKWLSLPSKRRANTDGHIKRHLRLHIYPKIGNMPVDKIKRRDLKALFDGLLLAGMSPSNLANIKTPISHVMNMALMDEYISQNPLTGFKFSTQRNITIEPLSETQVFTLLDEVSRYMGGRYYPHFLTLLRCGVRVGELLGLQWSDVDFEGRTIEVKRSASKGKLGPTKNGQKRTVDLTPHVNETLKNLRHEKAKAALKNGTPLCPWVFTLNGRDPMSSPTLAAALNECLKKAGLQKMRLHDCRHSYATIRLLKGHNLMDVSQQLGHSSIQITSSTYTHWIPSKFKNEVDDLDMRPPATSTQPTTAGKNLD